MEFKDILSQEDLDSFLLPIYWEHAFFREIYVLSPSFLYPDGSRQVNPDICPNMGMIILTLDEKYPVIELKFRDVEEIKISFRCDIAPRGVVFRDKIELAFNHGGLVRAKYISFRILTKQEMYGDKIKYGKYWDELFG